MANKSNENEDKKVQGTETEEGKKVETIEAKPENKGEQEDKTVKEKKPWSTKKKVGVGGAVVLTLIGAGCWIKNKFFGGDGEDESPEE